MEVPFDTASYSSISNLATLGNGHMFVGSATSAVIGNSVSQGLAPGADNIYRLGTGGGILTIPNSLLVDAASPGASRGLIVGLPPALGNLQSETLKLTAANTYTGGSIVNNASTLEGVSQATPSAPTASPFGSASAPLALHGGTLQLDAGNSATPTLIGALTFDGPAQIVLAPNASLTPDHLVRSNAGVLFVAGANGSTAKLVLANSAPVATATHSTARGGSSSAAGNGMVSPVYLAASGDFLSYDSNGFKTANYTYVADNSTTDALTNATGDDVVRVTAAQSLAADLSIYALNLSANVQSSSTSSHTLTISSGGLISSGTVSVGAVATPLALSFPSEAIVCVGASNAAASLSFNNAITAPHGLTKTGAGTLNLSIANPGLTGTVAVNQGTLAPASDAALGNASASLLLDGGSTLALSTGFSSARSLVLGASGGTLQAGALAGAVTWSGPISGNGPLIRTGAATLTFSGSNTSAGGTVLAAAAPTYVNAGSTLGSGDVVVQSSSLVLAGDHAIPARLTVNAGAAVAFLSSSPVIGNLSGSGSVVLGGINDGVSPSLFLNNTTLTIGASNDSAVFDGSISENFGTQITPGMTIPHASGTLIKTGTGTWTVYNGQAYSGGTTVNGGTLLAGANAVLGTGNVTVNAGGTLKLSAISNINAAASITLNGGAVGVEGDFDPTSHIASASTGALLLDANNSSLAGVNSSFLFLGATGAVKYTGSTLAPGANNTYRLGAGTGTLTIANDSLAAGVPLVVGGSVVIQRLTDVPVTLSAGTLQLKAGSTSHGLVTLSSLTVAAGNLDLTNHDVLLPGAAANLATLRACIGTSTLGPTTIINHVAYTATTAIALVSAGDYTTVSGQSSFHGHLLNSNDLVGVYAYKGDANLDGLITVDDYLALDTGYLFHLSGWTHGDFEQTGTISAADFADMDFNFAHQSGSLADSEIALHTSWFGDAYTAAFDTLLSPTPVPEPASLSLLGVSLLALSRKRQTAR